MRRTLFFLPKMRFWQRGFECNSRIDEFYESLVWSGGLAVRLCPGCQKCSGPPSGFLGGDLRVELEFRTSFFGLVKFYLAHVVQFEARPTVIAPTRVRFEAPVSKPLPSLLTFGPTNGFLYSDSQNPSQTFLIDCGVGFNEEENGGAYSTRIPQGLRENWQRIKAIVISHAHQDHWNLLKFKPPGIPVYCTSLARKFLEFQARFEPGLWWVLRDVRVFEPYSRPDSLISLDSLEIRAFSVPHSVPESMGFRFKLGDKTVVHLGEFKFQGLDSQERFQLETHLRDLGEEGVDLLVMDAQNIETPGFTLSEKEILESLRNFLTKISSRRTYITCFSSNLERIQGLASLAFDLNRWFTLSGTGMLKVLSLADPFKGKIILGGPYLTLIAGCQAEEGSALWKEAYGFDSVIRPGDTLIFSSRTIPGPNEERVRACIQVFQKRGVRVVVNIGEAGHLGLSGVEEALVHASGHASLEDVKLALRLLKPRYVLPRPPVPARAEQFRQVAEQVGAGQIKVIDESAVDL